MNIFSKKEDKTTQQPQSAQPQVSSVETPRAEVKRMSKNPNLMSEQQVQRTREALRLAETKLQNAEESLEHLKGQQDWLRRYNELKIALNQENTRLYELKKQQSSMAEDIRALDRYQTFETIQSDFLRMKYLEQASAENKRNRSALDREQEEALHKWEDQQKLQQQMTELREQAQSHLYQSMDQIAMGHRVTGALEALQDNLVHLNDAISVLTQDQKKTSQEIEEKTTELNTLNEKIERHRSARQGIEIHERMVAHGEAVLMKLDQLHEIKNNIADLRAQQADSLRRQNEENELLGRIFSQFQEVEGRMQSLNDEIHVHRGSIKGQNSFALQERAMRLKSRHQMLLSAQSLWNRISTGYNLIEEKSKSLNALRLHIEQVQKNIRELDTEVNRLNRLSDEKRYTYMLSKSQSVIQLRSDLKEGVQCSVCGATHHPYHSDTMLEQSKLIGDFKTEYDLLEAEARGKRVQLEDMKLDLNATQARYETEEQGMISVRRRQAEDVKEWHIYATLDKSFHDCSSSTNMEGRQLMLRQLIENTTRDAESAQNELDTFTYHQDTINELSEKLSVQEQRKTELGVRMNEVNTGCQVMAGHVERIQVQLANLNDVYSDLYDKLDKIITIPDWFREWNQNHEGLKLKIQQLMDSWENLNRQINEEKQQLKTGHTELEGLKMEQTLRQAFLDATQQRKENCQTAISEQNKNYDKALGKNDVNVYFDQLYQQLAKTRADEDREHKLTHDMMKEISQIRGRHDAYVEIGEMLSDECAQKRSVLDLWIRGFNTQHPPVQYAELERVFMEDRDWSTVREKVLRIQEELAICQAMVDSMRSRLIALQAEGGRAAVGEGGDVQSNLVTQRDMLETRRREAMMQVARLTVALEDNEKARQSLSSESLSEESPND